MRVTSASKSASMRTQVGPERGPDNPRARKRGEAGPALIMDVAFRIGTSCPPWHGQRGTRREL